VTWVLDVERPEEVTAAAAGRDAILALMRLWLDQLADGEPASSAEYS
jgi:hypothetical protein